MALFIAFRNRKGSGPGCAFAVLSYFGAFCGAAASVAWLFRHVLEFLHSGVSYACGAAFGGGSGSLGICPF